MVSGTPKVDEAGYGAAAPVHVADAGQTMPLVKITGNLIVATNGEIQIATAGNHDLREKPFKNSAPSSAVPGSIYDLVQHDPTSGNIDRTDPCALQVLLVRDHHPFLVNTLLIRYAAFEGILTYMGEDISAGTEEGVYDFQVVGRGVSHGGYRWNFNFPEKSGPTKPAGLT